VTAFGRPRDLVRRGLADHAYPAAAIDVGTSSKVLWSEAFGTLTYEAGAPAVDGRTLFDLASLTKVVATTSVALALYEDGRLGLDDLVARWIPSWLGEERSHVTVRDLLEHASGLPGYLALYERCRGRSEYLAEIGRWPLEYSPRSQSVYSDLGFILLGCLLERAGGAPLDRQTAACLERVAEGHQPLMLRFTPPPEWRPHIAPTEVDRWRGRLLVGEVHDENAWALGGVAGHAGLFGTSRAVGAFARSVLRARLGLGDESSSLARIETMNVFVARSTVPGSSRALGWDTMLPTSSCGTRMSSSSFGHAGFTGTTIWIDPVRDLYVVFLTNRVHPSRENQAIQQIRSALHDAIVECVDR
jgi:CubicO group peptidase (beta-lactamase class C family)